MFHASFSEIALGVMKEAFACVCICHAHMASFFARFFLLLCLFTSMFFVVAQRGFPPPPQLRILSHPPTLHSIYLPALSLRTYLSFVNFLYHYYVRADGGIHRFAYTYILVRHCPQIGGRAVRSPGRFMLYNLRT